MEIFRDENDGRYKIDYTPESGSRDRRPRGFSTLRAARESVEDASLFNGVEYDAKYIGWR